MLAALVRVEVMAAAHLLVLIGGSGVGDGREDGCGSWRVVARADMGTVQAGAAVMLGAGWSTGGAIG